MKYGAHEEQRGSANRTCRLTIASVRSALPDSAIRDVRGRN
jgi:hypothetical protein